MTGAQIASIEQKLLSAQIANAIAQVDRLEANLAQLKAANVAQIRQSDETAVRQQSAIDEQVAANEVRREALQQAGRRVRGIAREGHDFPERGHRPSRTS